MRRNHSLVKVEGVPFLYFMVSEEETTQNHIQVQKDGLTLKVVGYTVRMSFGRGTRRPKKTWMDPSAEEEAKTWIREQERVKDVMLGGKLGTVRGTATRYLSHLETSRSSRYVKGQVAIIKKRTAGSFGETRINEIDRVTAKRVLTQLAESGLALGTVDHVRSSLSMMWEFAIAEGLTEHNPFMKQNILPDSSSTVRRETTLLTEEEFQKGVSQLRREDDRELATIVMLCRFAGLKTKNIHEAVWGEIDTTEWRWISTTARRRIELSSEVAQTLREWWEHMGRPNEDTPVFPARRARSSKTGRGKGDQKGDHISYAKKWRKALLKAGITRNEVHKDTERTRRTTVEALRITYVALRGRRVCPPLQIAC